jgi:hypothetical protein
MSKLGVFISWSDKRSLIVAEGLAKWLPSVLRNVDALWSDRVAIGEQLFGEINGMLKQADFVVLCLTPENVTKTWINYEAGVVFGKTEKTAKVCPYLIKTDPDFTRIKLPTPLAHFNGVMADKSGTRKLIRDINKATKNPLSNNALGEIFKKKWPILKRVLDRAASTSPPPPRIDPIDDFMKVSRDIECHRDRLEGRFLRLIDQAINSYLSGTYSLKKTVDAAYAEIENSKERYKNRNSLLVGNVHDFFVEHFKKKDLKKIVEEMEADLKSSSGPIEMRQRLTARMLDILLEVFSRYHRILQNKLEEYRDKR